MAQADAVEAVGDREKDEDGDLSNNHGWRKPSGDWL
jgi:hypothetical protein